MAKYITIIIVLSIAIYANSVTGAFVSDDIPSIVKNPDIGELSSAKDLVDLSKAVIYKIGALNPVPYHVFNIILHALNSVLVFFFLSLFFKAQTSFWGALLFAAHPVHTEAVSWISGMPYLLLTLFLLISFLLYVDKGKEGKIRVSRSLLSLVFYILALFSHWYAAPYPAMVALYDITYGKWRKNWRLWLPFILVTLIFILARTSDISQRVSSLQADMGSAGMGNPLFNMAFSLANHAALVIWPAKLTLYHEPLKVSQQALAAQIIGLVFVFSLLPLLFRKAKPVFFGLGIFFVFLSSTYSPVPVAWLVAERYLYFASIGFFVLVGFLIRENKGREGVKVAIFLILLIGAYSARTIYRNEDWRSRAALWRATVRISPESPRAHNNMGDIYSIEGDLEKAAASFRRATELKPNYAEAYFNLASTCEKLGRRHEAELYYKKAIAFKPELKELIREDKGK